MRPSTSALISATFCALLLAACSKAPEAPAMPPLPVKVMDVIQRDAAIAAAAEAAASRAQLDVERYRPLVAENAISRQVYDNAVAVAKQTRAQADAAQLGLEYAEIRAPFDGRIGDADIFEGGLVSAGQTVLASISNAQPAWVYFSVSENDVLDFQRRNGSTEPAAGSVARKVRLTLGDGTEYPLEGTINFSDRALDPRTGTYRLRAEFENPDNALKPGMFARIRVNGENLSQAILVPERAVIQQLGAYFVIVVGPDSKAVQRPVKPGARVGHLWVIDSGLAAGDKNVVEGMLPPHRTPEARPPWPSSSLTARFSPSSSRCFWCWPEP